jgi:hypothetical protein
VVHRIRLVVHETCLTIISPTGAQQRGGFPNSSADESWEFARIVVEAGKNRLEVGDADVLG